MAVFYTASYYGKKKYQRWYDLVHQALKELHVELISPEEGNYQNVLDQETRKRLAGNPRLLHYEAIRQGIHLADAVVIEVSQEDIQIGHEATLAVMEKKPVLCLSIHEDYSKKIYHDYFFGAKYTEATIKPTLQDFLAHVRELRLAKRFNMFLYPDQLVYLEKASKRFGLNLSEYIRRLINLDRRATAGETQA